MLKPKNISKNSLINLYLKQKLSTAAIAHQLGCHSHVTVLKYLKLYGIPRRTRLGNRKPITISKKELINLYVKQHLTQSAIAKKIGHSLFGIQYLMNKYKIKPRSYSIANTKYPKYDFSGSEQEKAYLIGFRLGDLNVSKVHELIQVRCSTSIKGQVDLIQNLLDRYGHVHIWKAKRGTWEIVILLNQTFSFLLPKRDNIEEWVSSNPKLFLSFLAGYTDAEGSYYLRLPYYKRISKPSWGVFEIQSYDKNIINSIGKHLSILQIEYKLSNPKRLIQNNGNLRRLTIIKKQSLWNFIKLMKQYHRHKIKLQDLKKVKDNLILRNSLPNCKHILL